MMVYAFIGAYWTIVFWNNLSDYICGAAALEDYNKVKGYSIFKCAFATFFYHLGTVAFGSLVLLPCTCIQYTFGWIRYFFRSEKPNCVQTVFGKIFYLPIMVYEKFVMRVMEQAFGLSYYCSANFCPATRETYYLDKRTEEKIGDSGLIGFLYSISARLVIAFGTAAISNYILGKSNYYAKSINNPLNVVFVRFDLLWLIGHIHPCIYCWNCLYESLLHRLWLYSPWI